MVAEWAPPLSVCFERPFPVLEPPGPCAAVWT
jgi:hypothetical protein